MNLYGSPVDDPPLVLSLSLLWLWLQAVMAYMLVSPPPDLAHHACTLADISCDW